MKKAAFTLLILACIAFLASCTTYRGTASGGCQVNRNLVGYR